MLRSRGERFALPADSRDVSARSRLVERSQSLKSPAPNFTKLVQLERTAMPCVTSSISCERCSACWGWRRAALFEYADERIVRKRGGEMSKNRVD